MGGLTQGLENAVRFPGGTDGLEVQWQGRVVADGGLGALGLQARAGHPLPLQFIQLLHRFQLDLEALVLGEEGEEMGGHQNLSRKGVGHCQETRVPQAPQSFPVLTEWESQGHTQKTAYVEGGAWHFTPPCHRLTGR